MPLTAKGEKILANFKKEYGEKEGEKNFYASANAGTITGVHHDEAHVCGEPGMTLADIQMKNRQYWAQWASDKRS